MARLAGYGGDVYLSTQVIEDCEDVWNEQVDGDVTASLDNSDYKVGSGSNKFVCAAALDNGDIIASEVISSLDLTSFNQVMAWVKSSVNISTAGDLEILIDEDALCASPLALDIPTLTADEWTLVKIAADFTDYNAVISVGAKLTANDPGAFTLWIDHIMAAKQIAGVRSWSMDQAVDAIDVTGFDSGGHRQYIAGLAGWSGSFDGFKDGAPLTIGSICYIDLRESSVTGKHFLGTVIITGLSVETAVDGVVTYNYTFQGTDRLWIPTA